MAQKREREAEREEANGGAVAVVGDGASSQTGLSAIFSRRLNRLDVHLDRCPDVDLVEAVWIGLPGRGEEEGRMRWFQGLFLTRESFTFATTLPVRPRSRLWCRLTLRVVRRPVLERRLETIRRGLPEDAAVEETVSRTYVFACRRRRGGALVRAGSDARGGGLL